MSHIEKRSAKRWRARYRGPDGRERSQTFERRIDAERFLVSVEHSKATGQYVNPSQGRVTLGAWAGEWLESVRPTLKEGTFASYEGLLRSRVLPMFGNRPLAALRPSDVQTWVGAMQGEGLSPSRTRQAVDILRQVLDAAIRDGMVARNATHGVKLPKIEQREAAYFEPEIVQRIVNELPEPYGLLVRVLGTLGLRWGEATALKRRHVDLLRRRLKVEESLGEVGGHLVTGRTKTHAVRSVPLSPALASALEVHLKQVGTDPGAYLFTSPQGAPLRHRNFYARYWWPALRSLGLPRVGLHVLRHSAAARLISAGASPKAVQTILGHRSAAFSLTVYGHLFDADLDGLAARLDDPAAASVRPEHGLGVVSLPSDRTENSR